MDKSIAKNQIGSSSILLTLVRFITMGVSIITIMLLSKTFSLAEYGTYSQAILIVSVGTSFSILGLTDAVNYFYNSADDQVTKQHYIATIFAIEYFVGICCAIAIMVLQHQISNYFGNDNLQYIYIYISFSPLLNNLMSMYQVLFISIGKAKVIATRNLFVSILKLCIIAIACFFTKNITTIFVLSLILDAIMLGYFVVSYSSMSLRIKLSMMNFRLILPVLKYCIPMALYILTNALYRDIDKLIIGRFTDTETLAIYANCSKVLPFDLLTIALATVLIPYITKFVRSMDYDKAQHLFGNYLRFSYTTTWIIAFGAIVTAPELIKFLYGEKYVVGIWVFLIFIIVDMTRFANVSIILSAKGKTRALLLISFGSLIINTFLSLYCFELWGVIGPALASLFVTIAVNLLLLRQGAKVLNTTVAKLIDLKQMALLIFALLITGIGIYSIRLILLLFELDSIMILIISYGIYIACLGLLYKGKIINFYKEFNGIEI